MELRQFAELNLSMATVSEKVVDAKYCGTIIIKRN